uniref:Uncharacterized protein n=1 Tax=Aotus nancymaae TaxID=37293 RepID=A0A2K5E199_AOTNA
MNSQNWWDFPTSCFSCRGAAFLTLTVIQIIPEPLPQCYAFLLDAELTGTVRLWSEDALATPRSLSHSANCMISGKLTGLETRLLCFSCKQVSPVSCGQRQNMVFKANS